MIAGLSALYGKILVVMGLAFPVGEFISGEMPLSIYKVSDTLNYVNGNSYMFTLYHTFLLWQ